MPFFLSLLKRCLSLWSYKLADAAAIAELGEPVETGCGHTFHAVRAPPRHGLSSKTMALITSDYGTVCSLRTKWP